MNEQNKSNGEFSQLPVIAIIALVVGFFVIQDTTFNSTRPAISSAEKISTEDVRSRLWQDPFEAVALHRKKYAAQESGSENIIVFRDKDSSEHTYQTKKEEKTFVSSISPGFAYQLDNNVPQRICNSGEQLEETEAHSIEELRCQIQRDTPINKEKNVVDLQVLAVMVPGGPYAEEKEWRLRSRYAVISGMANAGFTPVDAEHIGFVDFKKKCINAIKAKEKKTAQFCDWPPYMPYEWFEPDRKYNSGEKEKANRVLVLWLDNHAYEQNKSPINMLGKLKEEIMPRHMKNDNKFCQDRCVEINFNIIGPHNSTTLQKMYNEIANVKPNELRNLKKQLLGHRTRIKIKQTRNYHYLTNSLIFSATATIDDETLEKNAKNQKNFKNNFPWLYKRIVRTITTQDEMAGTLLCELALRGVNPYEILLHPRFINEECTLQELILNKKPGEPNHIVLIGELDTEYSRNLISAIYKKIEKYKIDKYKDNSNFNFKNKTWVHEFNYLRGLDGVNAEQTTNTGNLEREKPEINAPHQNKTAEELRRPVGPNQYDYLRRLEDEISLLHKKKRDDGGIKAIGIVGSDVYDKLLILQALRKKFAGILFFTTDLDTRLLHPAEKKWTRNLIVASPFGLKLDKRLQNSAMPFRDNYQTSLFLSTIFAVHCWKGGNDCLKQKIADSDSLIEDLVDEIQSFPRLFEIGNHRAVDQSHKLNESQIHPKNESLSEEKLIDNTILFILLISFFTFLLVYLVPQDFRIYFYATSAAFIGVAILYIILQKHDSTVAETYSFTDGISTWPANAIRFFSIILIAFFFWNLRKKLKQNNDEITDKYVLEENKGKENVKLSLSHQLFIDLWRKDTNEKKQKISQEKPIEFLALWSEYRQLRKVWYCSKRVACLLILYVVCLGLLIATGLSEVLLNPYRGETSFFTGMWILLLATLMYSVLIFIIADIAHLSSHFISLLTKKTINWPKHVLEKDANKYNLDNEIIQYKTFLDFVVRHAGAVNQFIYYPFIILFLIILSRSYYFDNLQFTPLYLIISGFTALVTLASGNRLRRSALKTRTYIIEELNKKLYQDNVDSDRVKLLIGEIKNIKEGPFLPLAQHPIVLSLLMPFSGVGGLYLIEYMVSAA